MVSTKHHIASVRAESNYPKNNSNHKINITVLTIMTLLFEIFEYYLVTFSKECQEIQVAK